MSLTDFHRANLGALCTYLGKMDGAKVKFDMRHFSDEEFIMNATTCGSVGCAVGVGPYAGILKSEYETWIEYAYRCFGAHFDYDSLPLEEYDAYNNWNWLFSAKWATYWNKPEYAALRIRHRLKFNTVKDMMDSFEANGHTYKADLQDMLTAYQNMFYVAVRPQP